MKTIEWEYKDSIFEIEYTFRSAVKPSFDDPGDGPEIEIVNCGSDEELKTIDLGRQLQKKAEELYKEIHSNNKLMDDIIERIISKEERDKYDRES